MARRGRRSESSGSGLPDAAIEQAILRLSRGARPWAIFPERFHGHPHKMPPEHLCRRVDAVGAIQAQLSRASGKKPLVIYVHTPFCPHICPFCAFYKAIPGDGEIEAYVEAVKGQISFLCGGRLHSRDRVSAIYFGGGTPTMLSGEQIAVILATIGRYFVIDRECEVTVETSVREASRDTVAELVGAGVTRLSFGVQSFDPELRRRMARVSPVDTVRSTIRSSAEMGIDSVCVDLIYAYHGQSLRQWRDSLAEVSDLPIHGLSGYRLNVHQGTALDRVLQLDQGGSCGDIELEYEMFIALDTWVEETSWMRISPVNFSDGHRERAVYTCANLGEEYDMLAFGPSARGYLGDLLFSHAADTKAFLTSSPHSVIQAWEVDDSYLKARRWHQLAVGMALDWTDLKDDRIATWLPSLVDLGLLVVEDESVARLTQLGRFWSRNLSKLIQEELLRRLSPTIG